MNVPRHDPDLDLFRRNQPGAVGPEQQRLAVGGQHAALNLEHVPHGNALGDTDHEIQLGLDAFPDRRCCARRGHIDDRNIGSGLCFRFLDRSEDGNALEILSGLLGVDPGHERSLAVGVIATGTGVVLARLARDALGDDFGVFINENRHVGILGGIIWQPRQRGWPLRPWYWH